MTETLLTGAAGFVGHHVLDYLLTETTDRVTCLVSFEHKGLSDRLRFVLDEHADKADRVTIIRHDLTAPIDEITARKIGPVDRIFNIASESHVDRSITHPRAFVLNNTALILTMLEYAKVWAPNAVFVQMSTDEVYGPAYGVTRHAEWSTIMPSNPYSASKAAQEAIAFSYWRTYDLPIIITNTMNIFGPRQDSEKFMALAMRNLSRGESVPVHCAPDGKPGSRFWLPAWDLASALDFVSWSDIRRHSDGFTLPTRYNIVGQREIDNREMVELVAEKMGVKNPVIRKVDFHSSRPGHDLRYALDGSSLRDRGWSPPMGFEQGLKWTVDWSRTEEAKAYL